MDCEALISIISFVKLSMKELTFCELGRGLGILLVLDRAQSLESGMVASSLGVLQSSVRTLNLLTVDLLCQGL
jgi:hypothetical protein